MESIPEVKEWEKCCFKCKGYSNEIKFAPNHVHWNMPVGCGPNYMNYAVFDKLFIGRLKYITLKKIYEMTTKYPCHPCCKLMFCWRICCIIIQSEPKIIESIFVSMMMFYLLCQWKHIKVSPGSGQYFFCIKDQIYRMITFYR